MREVLRLPGYRAWLACRATSWFGDAVALLVLSMWVKSLTGSNGLAGLTFVFIAVPQLLGAFAGVVVDRLPKRGALIWGNVASALAPVPLLFVRGAGDVALIWVTAALLGVSYAVLPAVSQVILKQVVPTALLTPANSLQSAIGNGLQLLRPLIGAGLLGSSQNWLTSQGMCEARGRGTRWRRFQAHARSGSSTPGERA